MRFATKLEIDFGLTELSAFELFDSFPRIVAQQVWGTVSEEFGYREKLKQSEPQYLSR